LRNKTLLFFLWRQGTPVTVEEGFYQMGFPYPFPIRVAAEVGNPHIPICEFKVDHAAPCACIGNEPIGRAIISMAWNRAFIRKGRDQISGSTDDARQIVVDIAGADSTIRLPFKLC